jgi:hypothetical protein
MPTDLPELTERMIEEIGPIEVPTSLSLPGATFANAKCKAADGTLRITASTHFCASAALGNAKANVQVCTIGRAFLAWWESLQGTLSTDGKTWDYEIVLMPFKSGAQTILI